MIDQTFMILKPSVIIRGLIGEIISRLERKGLKIVGLKILYLDEEKAEKLYSIHKHKTFFEELIKHITSGPVVAIVVEGDDVVNITRNLIGTTDPKKALPGTIRGDYSVSTDKNHVHAADSVTSAEREIDIFFMPGDIVTYRRADENWI
jgi:nucleoside-diphosphate kinase